MGLNINDINDVLEDEVVVDQSVAQAGGGNFERKRLPIGTHPVRMYSYVELGMQDGGTYEGKQKPDEVQARMGFEFLGKRTVEERTKEGSDEVTLYAPRKSMTKKLSYHPKAGFYKLFLAMRGGDNTITHMGNMIATKAWLVDVAWRTKDDDGNYVNIKKKDIEKYETRLKEAKTDAQKKDFRIFENIDWSSLRAPMIPILDEDGEDTGETKAVPVRELIGDIQMFLWDNPKPMFWDSIHIEGSYTKKVEGKEVEVSKNFIQEMILGAKNFEGSPLDNMLNGLGDLKGGVAADDGVTAADKAPEPSEDEPKADEGTVTVDELDELGF